MKITVNKIVKTIEYPCLMVAGDGDIVLFCKENEGTMVYKGIKEGVKIGSHFKEYSMASFKPLKGSITLEND